VKARAIPTTLSIYSQVKKMKLDVVSFTFCYQIYKPGASHSWGFPYASNNTISDRNLNCTSIVDLLLGQREITNYMDRRVLKSPILWTFLGTFVKFQKGTISFVMSVCPYLRVCLSVRMEQLNSQWKDIHKIWCLIIFRKPVEKTQVSLKSEKKNGYFTWRII